MSGQAPLGERVVEGGLYNWDPHPGNYFFQFDRRLAMLDHGSTREFDHAFGCKLAALTRAVHSDARPALYQALVDLGMVREGQRYDFESARALVRAFHGPMRRDEVVEDGLARAGA